MTPDRTKTFAITKDMQPMPRGQRPGTQAERGSFIMQNIQQLHRLSRKSMAGFEFGTGLKSRQASTSGWGGS